MKFENNDKQIEKQKEKEIQNIFDENEKISFNQSGASSFFNNINSFIDLTITGLRIWEKNQDKNFFNFIFY